MLMSSCDPLRAWNLFRRILNRDQKILLFNYNFLAALMYFFLNQTQILYRVIVTHCAAGGLEGLVDAGGDRLAAIADSKICSGRIYYILCS